MSKLNTNNHNNRGKKILNECSFCYKFHVIYAEEWESVLDTGCIATICKKCLAEKRRYGLPIFDSNFAELNSQQEHLIAPMNNSMNNSFANFQENLTSKQSYLPKCENFKGNENLLIKAEQRIINLEIDIACQYSFNGEIRNEVADSNENIEYDFEDIEYSFEEVFPIINQNLNTLTNSLTNIMKTDTISAVETNECFADIYNQSEKRITTATIQLDDLENRIEKLKNGTVGFQNKLEAAMMAYMAKERCIRLLCYTYLCTGWKIAL